MRIFSNKDSNLLQEVHALRKENKSLKEKLIIANNIESTLKSATNDKTEEIKFLQSELKKAKDEIELLKNQNQLLKNPIASIENHNNTNTFNNNDMSFSNSSVLLNSRSHSLKTVQNFQQDTDTTALDTAILLSKQQANYGTNMIDSLKDTDEVHINKIMSNGFSRENAILHIFELKFGKVPSNSNISLVFF
jgi:predicted RNase H-like nuclease (RuvC/YqgF family)